MKRQCRYTEGDYQVWSGVANPNAKGVHIVYWRGMEIGRATHNYWAHRVIDEHKCGRKLAGFFKG